MGALITGAKLISGNDAFGENYSKLSAFIRW
jgi:hypothetical protein